MGLGMIVGIIGGFVGFALLGCLFFAYKRRACCFGCGSRLSKLDKGKGAVRDVPDLKAGQGGNIAPLPRAAVYPGAYPVRN
jgi:hypothetical protein